MNDSHVKNPYGPMTKAYRIFEEFRVKEIHGTRGVSLSWYEGGLIYKDRETIQVVAMRDIHNKWIWSFEGLTPEVVSWIVMMATAQWPLNLGLVI